MYDTVLLCIPTAVKRSELLLKHDLHPRDVRFKAASSLYMRGSGIILKLQVCENVLFNMA